MYTLFEEECKCLGEAIAEELASSPAGDIGEGPFPLHVAQLSEVHTAKLRVAEIREEIDEIHEQLAVIALMNENIDATAVVSDATAQMDALNNELQREVHEVVSHYYDKASLKSKQCCVKKQCFELIDLTLFYSMFLILYRR